MIEGPNHALKTVERAYLPKPYAETIRRYLENQKTR